MKGGLAAILAAAENIVRNQEQLPGTILVVATAREETIKSGGWQLALSHPSVDAVVCAEPTSNQIAIAATGSLPLRIDVHGTPGHSSQPGSGRNAIRAMGNVIEQIYRELSDRVNVVDVGERQRGVNVGMIRGGVAQPVVAAACQAWLDVRIFPGETKETLLKRMDELFQAAMARAPGVSITAAEERLDYEGRPYQPGSLAHHIHITRGMKPFWTDPGSRVVRAFSEAALEIRGAAEPTMMSGWGDIEFLRTDHNVPALYFGPGNVTSAHSEDEHIELTRFHEAVAIYEDAIRRFFGA